MLRSYFVRTLLLTLALFSVSVFAVPASQTYTNSLHVNQSHVSESDYGVVADFASVHSIIDDFDKEQATQNTWLGDFPADFTGQCQVNHKDMATKRDPLSNQTQQMESPTTLAAIFRGQLGATEFECLYNHEPNFEVVDDFSVPVATVAASCSITPQVNPYHFQASIASRYRLSGWKESNALYVHLNAHP
ncbi:hypothetical protein [Vibrio tapetis]|uniref:Uncharacterized protein n=1 Tax=Vibrio tapetis subsp. tapetis TaxID=1671868 RepID=A0A2N8ZIM3_9VIBR|nr:hypothetical protein [Vibrio tapetis]SON51748.1 exported protein of unknown function [Vibrio tapetis subsp. tapetis]